MTAFRLAALQSKFSPNIRHISVHPRPQKSAADSLLKFYEFPILKNRTCIMNKKERRLMLLSMDYIARSLNDEFQIEKWLTIGIADGDINYDDIFEKIAPALYDLSESDFEYYEEDKNFADLMDSFLMLICRACGKKTEVNNRTGVLYCDNVISKCEE